MAKAVFRFPHFLENAYVSRVSRLRQSCKRLTRLTYAFSKKWENLRAALALRFACYTSAGFTVRSRQHRLWSLALLPPDAGRVTFLGSSALLYSCGCDCRTTDSIRGSFSAAKPEFGRENKKEFPTDHYEVGPVHWLIVAPSTAVDVSNRLGITTGTIGNALVFAVSSYYGRAPSVIWDWIASKLGAPSIAS